MIALSVVTAVLAFVLSALVGHQAKDIGGALGLVDRPDPAGGRKLHARPTPLVGGMAVALSVVGAALLSQIAMDLSDPLAAGHFGWLSFAILTMTLIGVGDDRHQLSPRMRLAMSAAILIAVMYFDPLFVLSTLRFEGIGAMALGIGGGLFTLVCLIGLLNAVNMADGKNGLVIGLALIWALVVLSHAPQTLWPVLSATVTALCVLLWFNLHGKLFLGDGGSYGLSALFGLLAIDVHNQSAQGMTAEMVVVMFIVPVLDTIRLMSIRVATGKSPFDGDRNHFHHLLADKFGWPQGLLAYLAIVGLPNLLVNLMPETGALGIALSVAGYFALMMLTRREALAA